MWMKLADQVKAGEVDVVLHLGDQVYGQKEFQDAQAVLRYSGHPRGADAIDSQRPEAKRLHKVIKDRMRDIYRFTWNLPGTATVMSQTSNLMIWSDNDIYNDFTIAKEEGQEGLEPVMLYLAHQVYREYQRQLWDVDFENETTTDEFHFHRWGSTGVFIHDMRGNRMTTKGEQRPENPILNDRQWDAFKKFLEDPELKNLIVCSEIPYVGNSPDEAKSGAKKAGLEFLVDHWAYNDAELVKVFDMVFDWKAANKEDRDVVFVGGDIHVGVTSTIKDHKSGAEAVHLTATPISNHVCGFFPSLEGKINDRYSYTHVPLKDCRNYGLLVAKYENGHAHIDAKLIAGEPTHKHK
jgi:phosphodiesterase/alkaline phosphatase D-like protein